ncbi:hypothetical protein BU16DRAFT_536089 [Lophium mytilinum]|uniref:Uncharacterized protein n=1 Tax=Lophium mytilinum TaxID=390894 RepID=A0A6A6R4Y7_9PEZI|nr:hypothetical protein BU16DRAFT_536089 [Lophium mytilinum]
MAVKSAQVPGVRTTSQGARGKPTIVTPTGTRCTAEVWGPGGWCWRSKNSTAMAPHRAHQSSTSKSSRGLDAGGAALPRPSRSSQLSILDGPTTYSADSRHPFHTARSGLDLRDSARGPRNGRILAPFACIHPSQCWRPLHVVRCSYLREHGRIRQLRRPGCLERRRRSEGAAAVGETSPERLACAMQTATFTDSRLPAMTKRNDGATHHRRFSRFLGLADIVRERGQQILRTGDRVGSLLDEEAVWSAQVVVWRWTGRRTLENDECQASNTPGQSIHNSLPELCVMLHHSSCKSPDIVHSFVPFSLRQVQPARILEARRP